MFLAQNVLAALLWRESGEQGTLLCSSMNSVKLAIL